MPDPKLDLSRVSRKALEALARDVLDNPEWGSSTVSRIRAEATAERCQRCNGAGMRPCECGCGPMPCECRARHRSAPVTAEAAASLCYEGDCAKMTGRARPCPIHDAPTPRAELTGEERADTLTLVAESIDRCPKGSADDMAYVRCVGEIRYLVRNVSRRARRTEGEQAMSLHRRLNQMVESLEADLDGQVDNDLLVQDLMSFAGDAASLESRIAALAAELETTKARSQHNHDCSVRDANARAAAEEALATERAAREMAEKEAAQYKLWWDETSKSHDATNAHLERAEQERDSALERVKELERAQISPDAYMPREEVARLGIAQKALADWENGLPEPWRTYVMSLETNANPSGNIRDAFCQRQNAEALAARVKELEAALASARETLRVEREAHCDTAVQCEEWKKLYAKNAALRHIAESALPSARAVIEEAYHYQNRMPTDFVLRARSWLTSHPAPVAAPERGTRDVVETAIDLKDDKRSRWNALMARTAELPVTVMATSKYPSPAPCSGCAAVRAIVESVDKQHGHRCEDTSLVLSELADEILKVLNG